MLSWSFIFSSFFIFSLFWSLIHWELENLQWIVRSMLFVSTVHHFRLFVALDFSRLRSDGFAFRLSKWFGGFVGASGFTFVVALTASFLGLPRLLLFSFSTLFVISPESVIRLACLVSSGLICPLTFRYSSELKIWTSRVLDLFDLKLNQDFCSLLVS